ncbi:MAG: hypothetical protein WCK09_16310, partial [Bacteroidota bacterium]
HFDSNSPADNIAPTARNASVPHRATRISLLWSAVKKVLATIVIKSTLFIPAVAPIPPAPSPKKGRGGWH